MRFVLAYLDDHPGSTVEAMARAWKGEPVTRSAVVSVRRAAERLVEQGLVAREVGSEQRLVPIGWRVSRQTYRRRTRYRRIGGDTGNA
jgi:hypothetical protein